MAIVAPTADKAEFRERIFLVFYYRSVTHIIEDNRDIPPSIKRKPYPDLQRDPVYMFPRIVMGGVRIKF